MVLCFATGYVYVFAMWMIEWWYSSALEFLIQNKILRVK